MSVRERACVSVRGRAWAGVGVRGRACVRSCVRACVPACVPACVRACVRALNVNVLAFRNFENKTSWIVLNLLKTDNHISGALRKERVIYVSLRFEMMKADTNLAVALVARR